jgi:hypothetical protein
MLHVFMQVVSTKGGEQVMAVVVDGAIVVVVRFVASTTAMSMH